MTDNKPGESRRKLLKSIAAGSGAIVAGKSLPESWSRPVIDSVILPSHAQTSGITTATYTATGSVGIRVSQSENDSENRLVSMVNGLVPMASAGADIGQPQGNAGWYVCAVVDIPGGTAQVTMAGMGGNVPDNEVKLIRRGTLSINGEEGSILAEGADWSTSCVAPTPASQFTRPARIVGYSPGDTILKVQIYGDFWVEVIAQLSESGCLPEPPLANCDG